MKILKPEEFCKKNQIEYTEESLNLIEKYGDYINNQWEKDIKKKTKIIKDLFTKESIYLSLENVKYYHEKWIDKLLNLIKQ